MCWRLGWRTDGCSCLGAMLLNPRIGSLLERSRASKFFLFDDFRLVCTLILLIVVFVAPFLLMMPLLLFFFCSCYK